MGCAAGRWNTNTLCCLVPCLLHHESLLNNRSPDPDTVILVLRLTAPVTAMVLREYLLLLQSAYLTR